VINGLRGHLGVHAPGLVVVELLPNSDNVGPYMDVMVYPYEEKCVTYR